MEKQLRSGLDNGAWNIAFARSSLVAWLPRRGESIIQQIPRTQIDQD
jgi:hypothetical protein